MFMLYSEGLVAMMTSLPAVPPWCALLHASLVPGTGSTLQPAKASSPLGGLSFGSDWFDGREELHYLLHRASQITHGADLAHRPAILQLPAVWWASVGRDWLLAVVAKPSSGFCGTY